MPIQICETVKEALALIRASLPVSVRIRFDTVRINETIMADSTQIYQLIMNLCTNAADAMGNEGEIVIQLQKIRVDAHTVTKYSDLTEREYVCLTCKDTGHGMDPDIMDRVFEPYFTTKEHGKGTGMGLAQCYGIVKSHNGLIRVDSEVGKGALFEVLLPCYVGPIGTISDESREFSNGEGEQILFIDDEEDVSRIGGDMLERMGYRAAIETDPVKALNRFNEQPDAYDLAITDMTMPNISGIRVAEILKSIRPDIPIIISSGYSDIIERSDLSHMDHTIFLQKPYTMETLSKAIQEILK
jgi:CheY-like chemotaxis protein